MEKKAKCKNCGTVIEAEMEYREFLTPELIWSIKQNKPSLVAKDLQAFGIPPEITHGILLARGVYKWFSVRRQLIKLKNVWKSRIVETLAKLREAKRERADYKVGYLRGYLRAYEECRGAVRGLCHSERWQAPDFDRHAQAYLSDLTQRLTSDHFADVGTMVGLEETEKI